MGHTFESAAEQIARLRKLQREHARDSEPFQVCLGGAVTGPDDVQRWEEIGVTRLIVSPWRRSPEAIDGMRRFADLVGLEPRGHGE
jgi:hypothetical protein